MKRRPTLFLVLGLFAATLSVAFAYSTTEFPFDKGIAVKGIAADAGNAQVRGVICGSNVTCYNDGGGWLDLSTSGGGSGAPTNASYITEVAESGLSNEFAMASLGTGLVKNTTTTGVPSIYAGTSCTNQFPRSLNASGAATCASVALASDVSGVLAVSNGGNGSAPTGDDYVGVADSVSAITWRQLPNCADSSGQHLNYTQSTNSFSCGTTATATAPGGSSPQVQYNNSGAFGGVSKVQSDGTHEQRVAVTSLPSAPGSNSTTFDLQVATTTPQYTWKIDSLTGLAMPEGAMGMFSSYSTTANWFVGCSKPATWATSTTLQTNLNTPSTTGTAAATSWATTSWYTRQKVVLFNTTANTNQSSGIKENGTTQTAWIGNAAGAGGFIAWFRFSMDTPRTNNRAAVGMFNTTSALTASSDPNAATDTVYMGCNSGDSNFSMCSNDATGNATCNTLGSSYPCTTAGAVYDLWLYAPPNASSIKYYVERLDSAASTSGSISSDLPRNTVQLGWQFWANTASGSTQVKLGFLGFCIAVNP